jgi:hypothetical protein
MIIALLVLIQDKKNSPTSESVMAVAHDDDLQLIERMVGPSQSAHAQTELERTHHGARRIPSLGMQ